MMEPRADADVQPTAREMHDARVLTVKDRCDICPAQAFYLTIWQNGELLWCYHHFHEREDVLRAESYYVHDQSAALV
jgi:hypothetical protein